MSGADECSSNIRFPPIADIPLLYCYVPSVVDQPQIPAQPLAALRLRLGDDRRWVEVMAILTGIELVWWLLAWKVGIAPPPLLGTYLALAFGGLLSALAVRMALRPSSKLPPWPSLVLGAILVGLGASLFLPLKYAIPKEIPFWLDPPLASAERTLFGADPWRLLDQLLGWAVVPIDRLYGLWLPVQTLVLFSVMLQTPSAAKSRALIAFSLAWFLLGVIGALLLSSAGPLFYDAVFGEQAFAPLHEVLRRRGAWVVLAESDLMRESLATGRPGLIAGISAVPSIHVAISFWMILTARIMAPRLATVAAAYCAFIWLGSVQLGWHYVTDGLVGVVGMLAVWALAPRVESWLKLVCAGQFYDRGALEILMEKARQITLVAPKPENISDD